MSAIHGSTVSGDEWDNSSFTGKHLVDPSASADPTTKEARLVTRTRAYKIRKVPTQRTREKVGRVNKTLPGKHSEAGGAEYIPT